jgi:hypothetical protein
MVRVPQVIITNVVAAVAVVLASTVMAAIFIAAAATAIFQCHCPQRSHCRGCHLCPPLQHRNQMAMTFGMAKEAKAMATRVAGKQWQWQWQQHAQWQRQQGDV